MHSLFLLCMKKRLIRSKHMVNVFQVINMLLFILLEIFNIAAAQCGNSCNCGVTTCCQTTYSSGSPYSVFKLGNNQQNSYAQQYGSSPQYSSSARTDAAKTACLKTNPTPVSLTQVSNTKLCHIISKKWISFFKCRNLHIDERNQSSSM